MSKITISEAVQQYIAERTDVAGGYYEYIGVISQKHALEAAEMVKQETKEKCQIAFRNFMPLLQIFPGNRLILRKSSRKL